MRNTPSANTKNHATMFFVYWRTTQRLMIGLMLFLIVS
jgi:hypothetical protein